MRSEIYFKKKVCLKNTNISDEQIIDIIFEIIKDTNSTSERTATRDLTNLVKKQILKSSEIKGAGSFFYLESY